MVKGFVLDGFQLWVNCFLIVRHATLYIMLICFLDTGRCRWNWEEEICELQKSCLAEDLLWNSEVNWAIWANRLPSNSCWYWTLDVPNSSYCICRLWRTVNFLSSSHIDYWVIVYLATCRCVITLIRGLNSKFPCPVCLVPGDQLVNLSTDFPLCTSSEMEKIYQSTKDLNIMKFSRPLASKMLR